MEIFFKLKNFCIKRRKEEENFMLGYCSIVVDCGAFRIIVLKFIVTFFLVRISIYVQSTTTAAERSRSCKEIQWKGKDLKDFLGPKSLIKTKAALWWFLSSPMHKSVDWDTFYLINHHKDDHFNSIKLKFNRKFLLYCTLLPLCWQYSFLDVAWCILGWISRENQEDKNFCFNSSVNFLNSFSSFYLLSLFACRLFLFRITKQQQQVTPLKNAVVSLWKFQFKFFKLNFYLIFFLISTFEGGWMWIRMESPQEMLIE